MKKFSAEKLNAIIAASGNAVYVPADVDTIDVYLSSCKGEVKVCEKGFGIEFSEEKAKEILLESEIILNVEMNQGEYAATAWGCDLTYDYVKINGDYRT